MAVVQNTYTGNGSTVLYSLSFSYLDQADVKVSVNGTIVTNYIFATASSIQFLTAPGAGAAIRIYRETDIDQASATIFPGSAIKAQDLNDNFTQTLYAVQESNFEADSATTTANTALTTANTAISTANAATSTANTALSNSATAVSTANTASTNASNAVTTANTASSNASAAVTTANAATVTANSAASTAATALSTANTASSNASAAVSTANTASTNASNAVTTANTALSTANTASSNASTAVTTANNAVSTANGAVSTANTALSTANAAISAVASAVIYTPVANLTALAALTPSNGDYFELTDSTGAEGSALITGVTVGLVGAPGLTFRLRYDAPPGIFTFLGYFANDSETRYLKLSGGTLTGQLRGDDSTSASTPGFAFDGDPNTGIGRPGADELALITGGTARLTIDPAGAVSIPGTLGVTGAITGSLTGSATNNVLKAGDTMTGALVHPLGAVGTPSITFTGDLNTGIYSPGADQVAISTGGSGRLFVTSAGLVGIGTSSPATQLETVGIVRSYRQVSGSTSLLHDWYSDNGGTKILQHEFQAGGNAYHRGNVGIGTTAPSGPLNIVSDSGGLAVRLQGRSADGIGTFQFRDNGDTATQGYIQGRSTGLRIGTSAGNPLVFLNDATEQMRVDSSGRLLVGTSSSTNNVRVQENFGLVTTGSGNIGGMAITNYGGTGASARPLLDFQRSRGTTDGSFTVVASGDQLGSIIFRGADGSQFVDAAFINCEVDGTPGANDMPGRLVFSTTADGASSPTERMRITNGGIHRVTQSGSYNEATNLAGHYFQNDNNAANGFIAWNNSFTSSIVQANCLRAANSNYTFYYAASGNGSTAYADTEFALRGDGTGLCDGSWTGGGADYAEYFEWLDSNPDAEDRRGISVVLDGDKIREAAAGEDPIGVISGNPSVVGDSAWNKWSGKYLRDDFGTYIQEDYEVVNDEGETVIQQRRKLNPAYDPDVEYISREQRPEWDCVGLMGKLRIRKGQVTGSRWIKMRDISDSVEEWLVR